MDLDCADDIALLADNVNHLQYFVDHVVFFGSMLGLHVNPDKSIILKVSSRPARIIIQDVEIENVWRMCRECAESNLNIALVALINNEDNEVIIFITYLFR
jgi:hypothetical protein